MYLGYEMIRRLLDLVMRKKKKEKYPFYETDEDTNYERKVLPLSKIQTIDPPKNLDVEERDKWIQSIYELIHNKLINDVGSEFTFKDSTVGLSLENGEIRVITMCPVGSQDFFEEIHFNGKRPFMLREFLNTRVETFEDIIELEKSVVLNM